MSSPAIHTILESSYVRNVLAEKIFLILLKKSETIEEAIDSTRLPWSLADSFLSAGKVPSDPLPSPDLF